MESTSEEKEAFNTRVKASMRVYLRAKTWTEKVDSIARMNAAGKIAKEAMRKAQEVMHSLDEGHNGVSRLEKDV